MKTDDERKSTTKCSAALPLSPLPHPLGGVIQHLLPGRVKLPVVLLQEPLLGQGDGLLGCSEDLGGSLEVLSGLLGLQLSLEEHRETVC